MTENVYNNYIVLHLQESSCESVILRDINRTFPAHDFFKETGGLGQDSLYRISKAYAVYDEEVGYCQGLSFLVASLLLHVSNWHPMVDICKKHICIFDSNLLGCVMTRETLGISYRCRKNKLFVFWLS